MCLICYLYGAIPFGLLIGKARGVDLLQYGSGRTGATNTLRTLGRGASALAFLGDFSKGALAVVLARLLLGSPLAEIAAGFCAVAGHNWSVYIGFRGGRGVATSAGALAIMTPPVVAAGIAVFLIVLKLSRYVSLSSVATAVAVPVAIIPMVYYFRFPVEYVGFGLVCGTLVILQHKDNIERLLAGTERRIGEKAEKVAGS